MNSGKALRMGIGAAAGMLLLILDAKTAAAGAADGVLLCLKTVIPSLFPMFVLSILLTGWTEGTALPFLRPLGRICGIPSGGESLLVPALLGGYPVGAQAVAQAELDGSLTPQEARRMLGFCSNAGPAFLFGMGSALFPQQWASWALWAVHISSALLVGTLLPEKSRRTAALEARSGPSLSQALRQALTVMAGVCGWVVLLRVVLAILDRWVLWLLPETLRIMVYGVLELTNGFCALPAVKPEGLRFILSSIFLSLGGLCVTLQTLSVTASTGLGLYLPGKGMQTCLSGLLAALVQVLLFPASQRWNVPVAFYMGAIGGFILLATALWKKTVAFSEKPVYNTP